MRMLHFGGIVVGVLLGGIANAAADVADASAKVARCEQLATEYAKAGNEARLKAALDDPECKRAREVMATEKKRQREAHKRKADQQERSAFAKALMELRAIPLEDRLGRGPQFKEWERRCPASIGMGCIGVQTALFEEARERFSADAQARDAQFETCAALATDPALSAAVAGGPLLDLGRGTNECDAALMVVRPVRAQEYAAQPPGQRLKGWLACRESAAAPACEEWYAAANGLAEEAARTAFRDEAVKKSAVAKCETLRERQTDRANKRLVGKLGECSAAGVW